METVEPNGVDRRKNRLRFSAFRNVIALGFVSLFTDVSTEMCFSVLPQFIITELGSTEAVLGLIEGSGEATNYIFRTLSGFISEKLRKKKSLVFIGYAASNIVKPFFSTARNWIDALMIRLGDRIGKGIRTSPRDVLLSETAPEKHMGGAFGVHRTLDQTGAIIGPILAALLIPLVGLRGIFWISFFPGLVALIILVFFVKEKIGERREIKVLSNVRAVLRREFALLLFVVTIFSVGAFNFSFILLKAAELGASDNVIPIVYAVINVTHTLIAIPAGLLSDRVGKEQVLMLGYAVFIGATLLCIMLGGNLLFAFLIAAVYGVYLGIIETVQRALIPGYAPSGLRATAYGLYYLVVGVSFFAANTAVGVLWTQISMNTAFTYSLLTSIAAMVGMAAFIGSSKKKRRAPEPL